MRSPRALVLSTPLAAVLLLTACAAPSTPGDSSAVASPVVTAPAASAPAVTASPSPEVGPEEAFRSWWAAVRASDTAAACAVLTEELQHRMIEEYRSTTGIDVADCAALIEQTSALYAALGTSADVDVAVQSETAEEAVLRVDYSGGDCGTVHLAREVSTWMITELSQECGAG